MSAGENHVKKILPICTFEKKQQACAAQEQLQPFLSFHPVHFSAKINLSSKIKPLWLQKLHNFCKS
jgi:hypothetical protein